MSELLTRRDIAYRLGVSERQIHNLVEAGLPRRVRGRRVRYPFEQCRDWYVEFKQAEAIARSLKPDPDDVKASQARKLAAEARLAELEAARVEGELVPVTMHEEILADHLDRLRAKILNTPGAWAPSLVGCRTIPEALTRVRGLSRELLEALTELGDEIEMEAEDDGGDAAA